MIIIETWRTFPFVYMYIYKYMMQNKDKVINNEVKTYSDSSFPKTS